MAGAGDVASGGCGSTMADDFDNLKEFVLKFKDEPEFLEIFQLFGKFKSAKVCNRSQRLY